MKKIILITISCLAICLARAQDASLGATNKTELPPSSDVAKLFKSLTRRDTDILDLAKVGKGLVARLGSSNAIAVVKSAWQELGATNAIEKAKDVIWLAGQPPRVRDVAWMLAYTNEWLTASPAPSPVPAEAKPSPKPAAAAAAGQTPELRAFFEGVRYGLIAQSRNLDDHDINILAVKAYNLWLSNQQAAVNRP